MGDDLEADQNTVDQLWEELAGILNALEKTGEDPVTRLGGGSITGLSNGVTWDDRLELWRVDRG